MGISGQTSNLKLEEFRKKLDYCLYVYDEEMLVVLYAAVITGRPVLVEGAAGVGKTEIAKVLSKALGYELIRLQCYEGLDESKALYEWNYHKQLLSIQSANLRQYTGSVFTEEYLLERPLLKAVRSESPVVLLVDEIDKADQQFEAFLLEYLSDFQITIPELGTLKGLERPITILTSNNTRELSDALKRRCVYIYIEYPSYEKELEIVKRRLPGINERLAGHICKIAEKLREDDKIIKKPSIAETLDWLSALTALKRDKVTNELLRKTCGFVLKNKDDLEEYEKNKQYFDSIGGV